jgi:hypothetical protein
MDPQVSTLQALAQWLQASGPWGLVVVLGLILWRGSTGILLLVREQTATLVEVRASLEALRREVEVLCRDSRASVDRATEIAGAVRGSSTGPHTLVKPDGE